MPRRYDPPAVVDTVEGRAFVGRSGELARLRAAFATARAGRGTGIVLGGEAGVGKTRLIEAFLDEVGADASVLVGACLEFSDTGPPYAPFVEALRALVRATEPGRLAALLGPWRPELARLLPELAPRAPETAPLEFDRSAQARLFEIVLGVLERVAAARPLVLVIEDVHWADQSSRDLLAFLVRNLRAAPVLIVLSVRSDELHGRHPALPAIAELEREPHVDRIEVPRFGRAELNLLVSRLLGHDPEPRLVDAILARTDGNAFFAEQLVEARGETGLGTHEPLPPRLRDVLLARIGALSDGAQDVLRAASAAGRLMDDALLAAVLEVRERELAGPLREVIGRGILVEAGPWLEDATGYAFRHALLREIVYAELLTGERRALHGAFAVALSGRAEVAGQAIGPGDLAYHWDAARDYERALPVLVEAGRHAEAAYAFGEALRWYERALELWDRVPDGDGITPLDRVGVLQRAAEVNVLLGSPERAIELGQAALAVLHEKEGVRESPRVGHLQDRLRWFLWEAGDRRAASEAVRRAVEILAPQPPTATRARALAQLSAIDLHAGRYPQAIGGARIAIDAARAAGARGEEALALGVLGWATAVMGDVEGGIATYREGLAIAIELRGVEGIALGFAEFARMLDALGLSGRALEAAEEGLALARRMGLERTYGGVMQGHVANALFEVGRWHDADGVLDSALAWGPTGRSGLWLLVNRARLDLARGRVNDGSAALDRARILQRGLKGAEFGPKLHAALGELALARGDVTAMRATWDDAWVAVPGDAAPDPAVGWLGVIALRAEADGAIRARLRHDDAAESDAIARVSSIDGSFAHVDELLAGPMPHVGRRIALRTLAAAESERARGDTSPERWSVAAGCWDAIATPYPAAYARFREAEAALAVRGSRDVADAALRLAHRAAVELGADPLRQEVETLARHARIGLEPSAARAGTPAAGPGDGLGFTQREQEVLLLVAGGWSNQQIADALFISRKTASVHVSNILGKLGVASRGEAAAVAHRIGLGKDAPPPPGSEPAA